MKKLLLIILLAIAYQTTSQAQVDLQANPIILLWGIFHVSTEFKVNDNVGAGFDVIAADEGFGLIGVGKYYMNPNLGRDKFYIGLFLGGGSDAGVGGGFLAGYKWLSQGGVSFELSLGGGRGTGDLEFFPYAKLGVGYRFGGKE